MAAGGKTATGVKLKRVEAVINPLAGSVGPKALEEMQGLLEGFDLEANVVAAQPSEISAALDAALAKKPDLLIILAGDGTARAACELCGERGPLIAPLPGGTMNILPKALYGARDWKTALVDTLTSGVVRNVSGGEIGGHRFYVAAMVGWAALWGKAREAAREHRLQLTIARVRRAWSRAFTGRVRFTIDGKREEKAQILYLICPLISKKMTDETALEVAAVNPVGLTDALRVGARVLGEEWFGDWRNDPAVDMGECRKGRIRARDHMPALVDGESVRLEGNVNIRFLPKAFRALAPAAEDPAKV